MIDDYQDTKSQKKEKKNGGKISLPGPLVKNFKYYLSPDGFNFSTKSLSYCFIIQCGHDAYYENVEELSYCQVRRTQAYSDILDV